MPQIPSPVSTGNNIKIKKKLKIIEKIIKETNICYSANKAFY